MSPTGWTPQAVNRRRRTVSKPNRLSSWLNTRTGRRFSRGMARCRRSRHVAWNSRMAVGFFCVAGARHFKLGPEARAHEGVERLVLDLHPMRLPDPVA